MSYTISVTISMCEDENPVDMLSKSLSNFKFKHCLDLVSVCGA
jgi:hypothetical protein